MKSFAVAVVFAIILATVPAQETDESLKGSEALYLANPYGAYGAYPYAAAPAAFPAATPFAAAPFAPAAPIAAAAAPAAAGYPAGYPAAYYFRR